MQTITPLLGIADQLPLSIFDLGHDLLSWNIQELVNYVSSKNTIISTEGNININIEGQTPTPWYT